MKKFYLPLLALLHGALLLNGMDWNNPALNPVTIIVNQNSKSFTLFDNGKTRCVIVVPEKSEDTAFPWLTHVQNFTRKNPEYQHGISGFAALEFQKIVKTASGVTIPILKSGEMIPSGKNPIFIGMGKQAAQYGFSNEGVKAEGFKIQIRPDAMAILGAPIPQKRYEVWDGVYGVIFGIYDFAERMINARFYYPGPDGTIIPEIQCLRLPAMTYCDSPEMSLRIMYSFMTTTLPNYPKMDPMKIALKYRAGGHGFGSVRIPHHWSNPVGQGLKPAIDASGKIIRTNPLMPCFSSPESVKAFLKTANNGGNFLKILPPDHAIKCQCSLCSPLYDKTVPFHGQASAVYGSFIKKSADALKKTDPDKTLYFSAYYNYTSPAKGLILPDNTKVQLCLMYGQSLYHDSQINHYTKEWINDWYRITGKPVCAYVYPGWPGLQRSPFPRQYYHNLKSFFLDNRKKIDGLMSDGPGNAGIDSIHGSFYAMSLPTTYCEFRLLWNPEYDVDAGVLDMCKRMYGQGWQSMHKIITEIARLWESPATTGLPSALHLGEYEAGQIPKTVLYKKIIHPEFVKMLRTELDSAYAAVPKDSADYRRIDLFGKTLQLFFADYEYFTNPQKSVGKIVQVKKLPYKQKFIEKTKIPEWSSVPKQKFVNAQLSHGPKPPHSTTVQIAYDKQGLLLKFVIMEPEMDNIRTARQNNIWAGDCMEIFVKYGSKSTYHITYNADNVRQDRFIGKGPSKRRDMPYHQVTRLPDRWLLDVYLPFVTLDANLVFDPAKTVVRFNCARTRMLKNGYKHVSRWNTTFSPRHADEKAFGILKFE